ncbi:MAG: NAD(P)/FAD-dependent oxidoreductase [Actinomycetota bacterium]
MTGPAGHTVVGAGPAGLAAATRLAQAGRPVRVIERHRSVGHRFHGDLQGLENWSATEDVLDRLRRLGIDTDFSYRGFHEVTFYDSRLRPATARTRRPLFYLVRRGPAADTLDTALLRQARDAGADIRFGETARTAGPGTVVATGPEKADGIVAGFVFRTPLEDQAHAIVHPTLSPAGYAYLLVWDGRATLATCLFRDLHRWRTARDATVEAFGRLVPGLRLDRARPFGGYGGVLPHTRYIDESGRLYVGESAGLQDPEWGFGMVSAIRSGVLAASSLLHGTDYATQAGRAFDAPRATGFVNRAVFEILPRRLFDPIFRFEAGRPDLADRLRRHWAPNRAKSLLAPRLLTRYADRLHYLDPACHEASCDCLPCSCGHPTADGATGPARGTS